MSQSLSNTDTRFTGSFQFLVENEKFRQGVPPKDYNVINNAPGGGFGKEKRPQRKETLGPGPKYNLHNLQVRRLQPINL